MSSVSRGFHRRHAPDADPSRVPPGQYVTADFPVLSAGPTPRTALRDWTFSITGAATPKTWTWDEFQALPSEKVTTDIHCVTRWSKLDTTWQGVTLDTLLGQVDHTGTFLLAHCDGGYTTNLPIAGGMNGQARVAFNYGGGRPAPPPVTAVTPRTCRSRTS